MPDFISPKNKTLSIPLFKGKGKGEMQIIGCILNYMASFLDNSISAV